ARRLFRGDKGRSFSYMGFDSLPGPESRHRLRLREPGLDVVGDVPQRAERLALEARVIRFELGRVRDVGAPDDVLALHGSILYPEITVLDLGVGGELRRGSAPHHAPLLEHVVAVCDARQRGDVLVDEQDRETFA